MSRYINIEDAINLFGRDSEYHADTIADMLSDLPTIEIVHCKDCARAKTWNCPFYRAGYTYKDNDFCSDGERIEE